MTNPYQTTVFRSTDYQQPEKKALVLSLGQNLTLELFFNIIQSEQITLSTDITDHIVEDHTTVQDHITIKPRTFIMKGLISEKTYVHPDSIDIDQPTEPLTAKLAKLAVLAPTMSSYVSSAVNAATAIGNKLASIGNKIMNGANAVVGGIVKGLLKAVGLKQMINVNLEHNKWSEDMIQDRVIEILDYYRVNRIPLSVNTGWGLELKDNYYITDIQVSQGDTYQQSELSVTVKELRFTDIKLVKLTAEELSRYNQQSKEFTNVKAGYSSWMYNTFLRNKQGFE